MKVWVDAETGTWGAIDQLYVFDLDDSKFDDFNDMTDTDRSMVAERIGVRVSPDAL